MSSAVVVIGVGNEWRRDDGVGWAVARAAADELGDLARLVCTDGEPARLLDAWDGADVAVVVDAVSTGAPPGTVHVLERGNLIEAVGDGRSSSASHSLGLAEAVRLGSVMERLPGHLLLVGVEGMDFGDGPGLSAPVAGVVGQAACEVCRHVRAVDDLSARWRGQPRNNGGLSVVPGPGR